MADLEESSVAAVLSGLLYLVLRRYRPLSTLAKPAALEFALIATLYAAWRLARQIPLGGDDDAIERAHHLVNFQHALHLPTELSLQHFVLRHDWLGPPSTIYYAVLHVPALIGFLVWLFVRHPTATPTGATRWRSSPRAAWPSAGSGWLPRAT